MRVSFYFCTWLTECTGIWIGQGRVVCGIREFDSSNERVGRCLKMANLLVPGTLAFLRQVYSDYWSRANIVSVYGAPVGNVNVTWYLS